MNVNFVEKYAFILFPIVPKLCQIVSNYINFYIMFVLLSNIFILYQINTKNFG